MAATNPFKAKDLVAKYGWQIMPYLSNLGVSLLCDSAILFVDSGSANTLDSDDTEHGHSFDKPLATIDYAVGLCTANQGDVILVAPGHAETLSGAADLDIDVSGITIIGLAAGSLMPTLTLGGTDAATTIEINGDNITVKNIRIEGGDTDGTTRAIDIKTGSDHITLDGLVFFEPTATMEILGCITLEDKTDFCTIRNCQFYNGATGSNTDCVKTEADEHDHLLIEDCVFVGDWTNAILDLDAAAITYPVIRRCLMVNVDATTGDAIDLDSSTVAIMSDLRVASGDANAYPVADVSASFEMACYGCEGGALGYLGLGSQTATDFSA